MCLSNRSVIVSALRRSYILYIFNLQRCIRCAALWHTNTHTHSIVQQHKQSHTSLRPSWGQVQNAPKAFVKVDKRISRGLSLHKTMEIEFVKVFSSNLWVYLAVACKIHRGVLPPCNMYNPHVPGFAMYQYHTQYRLHTQGNANNTLFIIYLYLCINHGISNALQSIQKLICTFEQWSTDGKETKTESAVTKNRLPWIGLYNECAQQ